MKKECICSPLKIIIVKQLLQILERLFTKYFYVMILLISNPLGVIIQNVSSSVFLWSKTE
ncbi:hypothetical protein SAMN05444396_10745 [Flavobacterium segetis]|uniref:Uncharacterized protein n=1 Tax=Flavobacterium segetis TaxID=271157 RepID=A0A1M5IGQ9_9FLAO|nr:hypothetical protein SAMN05444396_10745 [Flavobacterium segetis]